MPVIGLAAAVFGLTKKNHRSTIMLCWRGCIWILAVVASLSSLSSLQAAMMTYDITQKFDNGQPGNPTGDLQLTFDDNAGLSSGHIKLTIKALNFDSSENVDDVFFNFGPNPPGAPLDPSKLAISQLAVGGGIPNTGIMQGTGQSPPYNQYKADGTGGFFDIEITFGHGTMGIMKGDQAVFDIGPGSLGSINLANFDYPSFSDSGDGKKKSADTSFFTAAHFQSVAALGGQSTWAGSGPDTPGGSPDVGAAPEPSSLALSLTGLVGLGLAVLRRRRRLAPAGIL